jgi:urocanate hydratase
VLRSSCTKIHRKVARRRSYHDLQPAIKTVHGFGAMHANSQKAVMMAKNGCLDIEAYGREIKCLQVFCATR